MNEIQVFRNPEFGEIRTVIIDNEPWFVGKDVATVLGYIKPENAIISHVENEDKTTTLIQGTGSNYKSKTTIINESGLYSLILSSKLPTAKKFKRWVTSEVLPSIRKHGMYAVDQLLDNPDFTIQALTALKEEREKRRLLESQIEADRPKVVFADAVAASSTCILVSDLAKLLKQNGIETGQKRLFRWLRENDYLIKHKGLDWNMPTQRSMEKELFEIKETAVSHSDGHFSINKTVKVTGKGQVYFIHLFQEKMTMGLITQ